MTTGTEQRIISQFVDLSANGTTKKLALPANPRRVGLMLCGDTNTSLFVTFGSAQGQFQGCCVTAQHPLYHLSRANIGELIEQAVYVSVSAAGHNALIETSFIGP